jgi:hypothetical protein
LLNSNGSRSPAAFADLKEQNGSAKPRGCEMTGRNWLLLGVAATLFSTAGCILPGYEGARLSQKAGTECDIPLTQRNQVYVFVVGGDNPLESSTVDKFRRGLNEQGFANVATGPSIYYFWMAGEMKRIHSEIPNAVFVIAGLETSAPVAVKLSEKAAREGLPVCGVVIADPTGKTKGPEGGLRTLFVGTNDNIVPDSLAVSDANKQRPSTDLPYVADVVPLLNEIAIKNPMPFNNEAVSDWVYPYATDTLTTLEPKPDSQWDFMFDRAGGVTRGIADPLPPRSSAPSTGNTTAGKQ